MLISCTEWKEQFIQVNNNCNIGTCETCTLTISARGQLAQPIYLHGPAAHINSEHYFHKT